MVKTGARAAALEARVVSLGHRPSAKPAPPRLGDLREDLAASITALRESFGGATGGADLRPGSWDLAFDGFVVELDEELHFNRYRAATLAEPWMESLPWRDDYRQLCAQHESACLAAAKWGKRWTNPSCEAMFGAPGTPGDLDGAGAPRWKQRALYDALKDAAALSGTVRLVRISTYDLAQDGDLAALIEARTSA